MLKRFMMFGLVISLIFSFSVSAEVEESKYQEVIGEISNFDFEDGISRIECIIAIMKVAGVDDCTAAIYANANYYILPFADVDSYDGEQGFEYGYIYCAKGRSIVYGVDDGIYQSPRFAPKRNITVQETLTAMLRCLKEPEDVLWDNVISDSVKIGLLTENEANAYVPNSLLQKELFEKLMYRMLDMTRVRYFPLEWSDDRSWGAKRFVTDTTGDTKYVDWYFEVKEAHKNCYLEVNEWAVWYGSAEDCPSWRPEEGET